MAPASLRTVHLGLVVGGLAALIALLLTPARPDAPAPERSAPPLARLIPARSSLVVTVALDELRRVPLFAALLADGRQLSGLGGLHDVCGFDPSSGVTELALSFSRGEDGPGLIARGALPEARLRDCAQRVFAARGGLPVASRIGGFSVVRATRGGASVEVASRDGVVLLGEGRSLRELIDTADGLSAGLDPGTAHHALRQRFHGGVLLATAALEEGWIDDYLEGARREDTPLSGLRQLALHVEVTPRVKLEGLLRCETSLACVGVKRHLDALLAELGPTLDEELGAALSQRLDLHVVDNELRWELTLDDAEARRLGQRALAQLSAHP